MNFVRRLYFHALRWCFNVGCCTRERISSIQHSQHAHDNIREYFHSVCRELFWNVDGKIWTLSKYFGCESKIFLRSKIKLKAEKKFKKFFFSLRAEHESSGLKQKWHFVTHNEVSKKFHNFRISDSVSFAAVTVFKLSEN